jgi:hypothetical protein
MRQAMKLTACLTLLMAAASWAIVPPKPGPTSLASKSFFKPELYLPLTSVPLSEAQAKLPSLKTTAWNDFFSRNGDEFNVYLDMRTGAATSVQGVIPMIPGKGYKNSVTLNTLSKQLGHNVGEVTPKIVGELIVKFVTDNQAALGVSAQQLGEPKVTQIAEHLWNIHIPQTVNGVAVRHAKLAAVINHGNLVLLGTESWANVDRAMKPVVSAQEAVAFGGDYAGLYESPNGLWKQPELEILPMTAPDTQAGQTFIGNFGKGYEHRMVWTYGFQRKGEDERWKVSVDAETGEVLAMEDDNHYFDAKIKGGIYPTTNVGICNSNEQCGTMQPESPMPWTNTGLPAPNNFTDGAGIYDYSGTGSVTTTLDGKYVKITDSCGVPTFTSATGTLEMGGLNNDHDCTSGGQGAGNTAAARSCFYETNKLAEQARGWLPSNTWLTQKLTANVNLNSTCNAFWDGSTVNFYKSGGGCRNTGEIGAVFDHEWGHGIDDFDSNGTLSSSSEGYADIAAIYRLQTSCVGYGFFHTLDDGCGQTADGTGSNVQEAQTGPSHCATDCSGVRDADFAKHIPATPQTPVGFNCVNCGSGSGPCGKQVHCAAGPTRQAAWDFVFRDLRGPPYNYDSNTAFIVANKIFYQGSGLVGSWHECNCTAGTSSGCGATNGYMQWLAADDNDGNLSNGTPHMPALYAAFNRHGMACTTPAVARGVCAGAPTGKPQVSATPNEGSVDLSWSAMNGATKYWVMKTEGFAGCNFGKAKIAEVTGTSYTDGEVANGRQYCYSIVAQGSSAACYSEGSECACVTPACTPPGNSPTLAGPNDGSTGVEFYAELDWNDLEGLKYEVQVATDAEFTNVIRSAKGLTDSGWTVSPALAPVTTYYWRVRAVSVCGGASAWSTSGSFTTRACIDLALPLTSGPANGATGVAYTPTLDWGDVERAANYEVDVALDASFANVVASAKDLLSSSWTVSPALAANTKYYWRVRAKDVCAVSTSTTASFTTANLCSPSVATFNPNYQAPYCATSCGCDTSTLVRGRGTTSGAFERNYPNTINDSCADGNSGTSNDGSVEKLVVKTLDRSTITPGKQVRLEVSVRCGIGDRVDLYYATNAVSPSWSPLLVNQACTPTGAKLFTHTFNVADVAGAHAIRAQVRNYGMASPCTTGSYNDHDDLVFSVSSPVAGAAAPGNTAQGRTAPRR